MNKDCAVARDLMPLVIDRVASGESRAFVEEHIAACAPCAQVYADMQNEIRAIESSREGNEAPSFQAAVSQLRKTMGWRRLRTAVLAAVLTIALVIAGYGGYYYLIEYSTYTDVRALPLASYTVSVYQGSDGTAYGATAFLKNYNANVPMILLEDGGATLYIYWSAPILLTEKSRVAYPNPQYGVQMTTTEDGGLTLDGDTVLQEIRQGKPDDYIVVYRAGDAIPPLDPATDAYFQLQTTYFNQLDEAQQMREDAEQIHRDAQDTYYESLDQPVTGTAVPDETPAE